MGLKKDNYIVKGVSIAPAYAKIDRIYLENGNIANVYFGISNTRENIENNSALEEINFNCEINKSEDRIYSEIYTKAKESIFIDWQDDIVEE